MVLEGFKAMIPKNLSHRPPLAYSLLYIQIVDATYCHFLKISSVSLNKDTNSFVCVMFLFVQSVTHGRLSFTGGPIFGFLNNLGPVGTKKKLFSVGTYCFISSIIG